MTEIININEIIYRNRKNTSFIVESTFNFSTFSSEDDYVKTVWFCNHPVDYNLKICLSDQAPQPSNPCAMYPKMPLFRLPIQNLWTKINYS